MEPPPVPPAASNNADTNGERKLARTLSMSQSSDDSQTAADFIDSQLKLEADAREALPYKFDSCTRPLGPLRQLLFACLTCNPPPETPSDPYTPAAVCYSCSVQCHGEHTLVELFNKRNFVCDCGTTRLPTTSPCNLRLNTVTNQKGGVVSEEADPNNKYNLNFQNRFCGCNCDYDAHQQKGTMFQCLGLEEGGCGEDWWHPGCVVGLGPTWYEDQVSSRRGGKLDTITEDATTEEDPKVQISVSPEDGDAETAGDDDDVPPPPGFPEEDEFEGFICYKCVEANPWIKRYAGSHGFLAPVFRRSAAPSPEAQLHMKVNHCESKESAEIPTTSNPTVELKADDFEGLSPRSSTTPALELQVDAVDNHTAFSTITVAGASSGKRKLIGDQDELGPSKRVKDSEGYSLRRPIIMDTTELLDKQASLESKVNPDCKYEKLPPAPEGLVSLFFKSDFRDHLCRCSDCFPKLAKHAQLLEEEEAYEPPVSEDGEDGEGSTVGSGSLLDRGERALTNVDRVRAIEGVMAYNHLKEKLKPFFKEFAESGKAISAEDIKAHFAKIRGDEEAIRQAGEAAASSGDNRREQSGY